MTETVRGAAAQNLGPVATGAIVFNLYDDLLVTQN